MAGNFGNAWIEIRGDSKKLPGDLDVAQKKVIKAVAGIEKRAITEKEKAELKIIKLQQNSLNLQKREIQKYAKASMFYSKAITRDQISKFKTVTSSYSNEINKRISLAKKEQAAKIKAATAGLLGAGKTSRAVTGFTGIGAGDKRAIDAQTAAYNRLTRTMRQAQVMNEKFKNGLINTRGEAVKTSKSFKELTLGIFKSAPAFAIATAGIAAIYGALRTLRDELVRGFTAVEDFKINVISMSAFITTFSKQAAEGDIAGAYQAASGYAGQLVQKLEVIDALTIANAQDLRIITESFIKQGVLLDVNNQKQVKGFINITNALKLLTKGQNQSIQLRQEIRALVSGQLKDTNVLVKTLEAIDPQIKSHLKTWKEQGVLIEKVGELLVGFGPAATDFQTTFAAAGTTLETIHDKILRGAFGPSFEWLIGKVIKFNKSLMDSEGNLTELGKTIQSDIQKGLETATKNMDRILFLVKSLYKIYSSLGDGAATGLLGAILIGRGNILVGSLLVIDRVMAKTGNSIFDLSDKAMALGGIFDDIKAIMKGMSVKEYTLSLIEYRREADLLLQQIKDFQGAPGLVGGEGTTIGPQTAEEAAGFVPQQLPINRDDLGLLEQNIVKYAEGAVDRIQEAWEKGQEAFILKMTPSVTDPFENDLLLKQIEKFRADMVEINAKAIKKMAENMKAARERLLKQRKDYDDSETEDREKSVRNRLDGLTAFYEARGVLDLEAYNFRKFLIRRESGDLAAKLGNDKDAIEKAAEFEKTLIKELNKERKEALDEIAKLQEDTFSGKMKMAIEDWGSTFADTLTDMLTGAETTFDEIVRSFGKMILNMVIKEQLLSIVSGGSKGTNIAKAVLGAITTFSGAGTSGGMNTGAPAHVGAGGTTAFGMANGAVLKGGFQAFANGSPRVTEPTLGLIGEGRFNEAVVPLPDGRKIPVDMRNNNNKADNINIELKVSAPNNELMQQGIQENSQLITNIVQQAWNARGQQGPLG